jgi:hypothetical protein
MIALAWLALLATQPFPDDGPLAAIERRHGIEVVSAGHPFPVATRHGPIEGKDAPAAALRAYGSLLRAEFDRHPAELLRRARLRKVVLCDELVFGGLRVNAVPDYEHETLYLDAVRGAHSPDYQRKVIHHDFFHMVDYRDDGLVYRDDSWAALNPPGFAYGAGGRASQGESKTSVPSDDFPGFLNHYSTTGVEEDKAEVFAFLMVEPEAVLRRAEGDPVLRAKVGRLREIVSQFCPETGDPFWRPARK